MLCEVLLVELVEVLPVNTFSAPSGVLMASAAARNDSGSISSRHSTTRTVIRFTVGFQCGEPSRMRAGNKASQVCRLRDPPNRVTTSGYRHMWRARSHNRQFSEDTHPAIRASRSGNTLSSAASSRAKLTSPHLESRISSISSRSAISFDVLAFPVLGHASSIARIAWIPRPGWTLIDAIMHLLSSALYVPTSESWSRHSAKSSGRCNGAKTSESSIPTVVLNESSRVLASPRSMPSSTWQTAPRMGATVHFHVGDCTNANNSRPHASLNCDRKLGAYA
mmetsp:Transcript_20150/g.80406  ORF Transcript_20150/g.80406 Transcript_20150/m.80406 type:complete len:279 (-) Transcript_20150:446-1282(-)